MPWPAAAKRLLNRSSAVQKRDSGSTKLDKLCSLTDINHYADSSRRGTRVLCLEGGDKGD